MILRSLFCITVVALTASQIEWKEPEMIPHKDDLIRRQIYNVYDIDCWDLLPGQPVRKGERLIVIGEDEVRKR